MFEYYAELKRIIDGDTVDLEVDLGFNVTVSERFRLAYINTPEIRTKDNEEKRRGMEAKNALTTMLAEARRIKIRTDKDRKGKFGRWIATIYVTDRLPGPDGEYGIHDWFEVNTALVSMGHAQYIDY